MNRGNKIVKKIIVLFFCLISLTISSSTQRTFRDVTIENPYYESIEYLTNQKIISGIGNSYFQPDDPITIQQWSAMICRSQNIQMENWKDYSSLAYQRGWIDANAIQHPTSQITYCYLLESAFKVKNIPIYDNVLYNRKALSNNDNIIRIGKELAICSSDIKGNEIVNRGQATLVLYNLLTKDYKVEQPKIPIKINNKENIPLNDILLQLQAIPKPLIKLFNDKGWVCNIDYNRIHAAAANADGLTSYTERAIYITDATSLLHEFGHFYHGQLNFPTEFTNIYYKEAQKSILRQYAKTNSLEYFADCFAYWIKYQNSSERMDLFKANAPLTYEYMNELTKKWGTGY